MQAALHGESIGTGLDNASFPIDGLSVAVIIPTFNHARFLTEAIVSVLAQTRRADEIIVVDDGSTDDTARVVAQFPTVRLIRQNNRGPSAARNTGLWNCKSRYVVFLDADDRLLPAALEAGLACIADRPDCALVYGGCHFFSENGHRWSHTAKPINGNAHRAFLRQNQISGLMAVLFRCDCLLAVNGFDEALRRFEDHDLYLRMTQRHPIASHPTVVAEYRKHDQAASNNCVEMLKAGLLVLHLNETRIAAERLGRAAAQEGRTKLRRYYVSQMLDAATTRWHARRNVGILTKDLVQATRWSPSFTICSLVRILMRRANRMLRRPAAARAIKKKSA